jgi:aminoglycoside phosphotransferase (APT) family kinase protein
MFLVKADLDVPPVPFAEMRKAPDADFGIDSALLQQAATSAGLARLQPTPRQGTFHRIYEDSGAGGRAADTRTLVRVAVFAGEPWTELMELECLLARLLRQHGIPAPSCAFQPLDDDGAARGAQSVERVEGDPLDLRDADEAATVRGLRAAAMALARVHAIRGAGAGPLSLVQLRSGVIAGLQPSWPKFMRLRLEEHLRECEAMGAITAREAGRVREAFTDPLLGNAPSHSLLHGDPGGHNFILRGDTVTGIIDWEDVMVGDPVFELASMCTFHPQRRHAAILEGYGMALAPGSPETRRFWLYFLRIALAKTVHRHRFGYADAPGRAPAAKRIQLALKELGTE